MTDNTLHLICIVIVCLTVCFLSTQMVSCEKTRLAEYKRQTQINAAYKAYTSNGVEQ